MSEDKEKIEIDIENKYIRNKEKTKFTIAECFHILKSKYYCDEVEDIAINCLKEFYTLNENDMNKEKYTIHLTDEQYRAVIDKAQEDIDNKWKTKIKDKIKELEEQCETELLTTWLEAKIEVLEDLLKENNI